MKKVCSLLVILIASHFFVSAQYNKGSIYIDGNVSYNNDNFNVATLQVGSDISRKSHNLILSPNVGYFVANNFAIGVGLEYQSLYNTKTSITESSFNSGILDHQIFDITSSKWNELAPTVFAKYIFPISDKISFSLKAKFSHGLLTDEVSVNSTTINYDTQGKITNQTTGSVLSDKPSKQTNRFSLSPEFQYLITDKIGLQVNFTGLSYNSVPVINQSYETLDGVTFNNVINYGTEKTTTFNINPSSWSFGLFILLGGKDSKGTKESK
jgi:outer membrane protein